MCITGLVCQVILDIPGNGKANESVRTGSEAIFVGPTTRHRQLAGYTDAAFVKLLKQEAEEVASEGLE